MKTVLTFEEFKTHERVKKFDIRELDDGKYISIWADRNNVFFAKDKIKSIEIPNDISTEIDICFENGVRATLHIEGFIRTSF